MAVPPPIGRNPASSGGRSGALCPDISDVIDFRSAETYFVRDAELGSH